MKNQMDPFLSICFPTYNRPKELAKALNSVDSKYVNDIEIVVSDNNSDDYDSVKNVIESFECSHDYLVRYFRNDFNIGYDANIRNIISKASGKWVMLVSDDDLLVNGALDKVIDFLKAHEHMGIGYVLRRYISETTDGRTEDYRYYAGEQFWPAGERTIVELFRKSVFLSGFTFRRSAFSDTECKEYDGTLLFQLYVMSVVCLKNPAAYCDITISKRVEGGIPLFGDAKAEKGLYVSGNNSVAGSVRFLTQVKILTESFDEKFGTHITPNILKDYSKYSFGFLQEHRDDGRKVFKKYAKEIKKLGMADSGFFYIYYYALLILGRKRCFAIIRLIKRLLGKTPRI